MIEYFIITYGKMLLASIIGTLGFCLLFKIKLNKLIYGCIGGTISICVYFITKETGLSIFFQNFFAAVVATLYAEIVARIVKAPSTVFLIPSVIPLTPGSLLYYTMQALVDGEEALSKKLGKDTGLVALGIALGIVVISAFFYQATHMDAKQKENLGSNVKNILFSRK